MTSDIIDIADIKRDKTKTKKKKKRYKSRTFIFEVNKILDMAVEYTLVLKDENPDDIKKGLTFLIQRIKTDYPNIMMKY